MSNDNVTTIKLTRVRLSFPAIFRPSSMVDDKTGKETEPKYGMTAIISKTKQASLIKEIEKKMKDIASDHFKGKIPGAIVYCLKDGATKDHLDGYGSEVMFMSASCSKRPPVVDRSLNPLVEADGTIYAGCYVNATVRLWVQDNKFGKRVNANLRAVQFVADGEAFGDKSADPTEEFDALDEDTDSDGDDDLLS